ncbi:alpha/beta fold hydrolase [Eubacterium oxidoreducens]|uniref:Pimeloyl-ACP methyl ester carboxylesterase n=1 Tax=Eubacterium oxidoreducens TaxID=1732 RepID=A0A1G6CPS5_EUBOX|nr:alpha/beta fold hydrolase [Eubacterium oxidoreducens]SDB34906.1 Pimeloyl-ACP methyl ester carboxylesterase [Eubacterium oxidoreducens]
MNKKVINTVLIGGAAIAAIYGANKLIAFRASNRHRDNFEASKIMTWRYGNISYIKKGKGSPILLIHDLNPASSRVEWDKIISKLSKTNTVYALDLLGCGDSEKPNMTYTNYLYVQLLTDFIKKIIGQKTDVIATGDSGSFTIMACNMNPDCFNKIVLVNPTDIITLSKTPGKRNRIMKKVLETPIFGTSIYNMIYSEKNIILGLKQKNFFKSHLISNSMINEYYVSAHNEESRGKFLYSSIFSRYTNINIAHALKKLNHSIYIIEGTQTPMADQIIETYIEMNPSIEATYIENTSRLPQLEKPESFLSQLKIFLES